MRKITSNSLTRRTFLATSSALGVGLAAPRWWRSAALGADPVPPSKKIIVGVMGTSHNADGGDGRGSALAAGFASLPGAEVAYVCDVDARNVGKTVDSVAKKQSRAPKGVKDFHAILDDPAVDALVVATPDHWHGPATLLGCAAGKHVYVEKPASHNAREGEWMTAAARDKKRIVQLGTQRRSWPGLIEAMEQLKSGAIGRVISAKCYYTNGRLTIGHGKEAPVPEWLDYSLWQGPAPEKPFRDNLVHYNWHWFWHWGTGEMGNNGIHYIDLARWGLGVDYPTRVISTGGKYRYDDDQETPDTNILTCEFGDKLLTWEGRSWAKHTPLDPDFDVCFHGEKGMLAIRGTGYSLYDADGKETSKVPGVGGDAVHLQNFINAIQNGEKQNAPIEEGVKSTLLCHLGNISYRVGRAVKLDPKAHTIAGDEEAAGLWGRTYRKGWEPVV